MAVNIATVAENIFNLLKGYGYNVTSYDNEGKVVFDPTTATRFAVDNPNILVRIDETDQTVSLSVHREQDADEVDRLREQLKKAVTKYMYTFDFGIFGKRLEPKASEKIDIERKRNEMEESINDLRKRAGLPVAEEKSVLDYPDDIMHSLTKMPVKKLLGIYANSSAEYDSGNLDPDEMWDKVYLELRRRYGQKLAQQATQLADRGMPLDRVVGMIAKERAKQNGVHESQELEEGLLNDMFQTIYDATGKLLDKLPVIGDKREQKRIVAHRNNFMQTMTDEKIQSWREELRSTLKSDHSASERMFAQRFEVVAKRIQAAKKANDPKSYTNAISGLTRATRDLEKAVKKSNTGVQQRRAAAKRKKRMGEGDNVDSYHTKAPGAVGRAVDKAVGIDQQDWNYAVDAHPDGSYELIRYNNSGAVESLMRSRNTEKVMKKAAKFGVTAVDEMNEDTCSTCHGTGYEMVRDPGDGQKYKEVCTDCDAAKKKSVGENDMGVMEGFGSMTGSTKTSYQPLEDVKIVVKHRKPVNEESRGARSRNIQSIYLQRGQERFKMQETNLKAARAMARHLTQGGEVFDSIGEAIVEMAVEQRKLKEFVRYVNKKGLVNEANSEYVQIARENIGDIKRNLDQLSGAKTYARAVESVTNYRSLEILEDDVDLESQFTETHFDDRVANAGDAIRHSIAKRQNYRRTVENAIQNETFEGLKNALRETEGVVQYSSPQAQLSHQVTMMGDAAQDATLRNHLQGISKRLDSGERLNDFDYKTVKGCLYNANQTQQAAESVDTVGQLAEGYKKFLSGFDMY